MFYTLKDANEYIIKAKEVVNPKFRMAFHMMPPVGWMNDPNGLVVYKGKYHLFYQFYPYSATNGPMHWGHMTSADLISSQDEPVALAPEGREESGCFSGGALVAGDRLNLIYTRHFEYVTEQTETVCMATSDDGVTFSKQGKPCFDNDTLPEGISRTDFRDPYPVKIGDRYYVFIGGKLEAEGKGVIIILSGKNLSELEYDFSIGPFYELGEMCECPSYCKVDGKDVIMACGVHVEERGNSFKNSHACVFITGDIDFAGKKMCVDGISEIDKGDALYAPQFINGAPEPIMLAWFELWEKRYPTQELRHGWVGAMTIPRRLFIKNGRVHQQPVAAIENYRLPYDVAGKTLPKCADITAWTQGDFRLRIISFDGTVIIGGEGERIYLDTTNANNLNGCVRMTNYNYHATNLRIILDVSGIELFVADGKETFSSRIYLEGDYNFETEGGITLTNVYEIGVRK